MSLSSLFERLGAPLANIRWSWGSLRDDGSVVLRVWQDATLRKNGKMLVRLTHLEKYGDERGTDNLGYAERLHHVDLIRKGAKSYLVMCLAKDETASPREVKSFNSKDVFVGGDLVTLDGEAWVEIIDRVRISTVA